MIKKQPGGMKCSGCEVHCDDVVTGPVAFFSLCEKCTNLAADLFLRASMVTTSRVSCATPNLAATHQAHHNATCSLCKKGFEADAHERLCHDCFFVECHCREAWPTQATDKQKRVLAHGVPKRNTSKRTTADLARIAESKVANAIHGLGAVCPDTDEHGLEAMRIDYVKLETDAAKRLYGEPIDGTGPEPTCYCDKPWNSGHHAGCLWKEWHDLQGK
jgi:hypothetical protein